MTPLQLGMPYSRPRYYALGRRKRSGEGSCSFPMPGLPLGRPFAGPPGLLLESIQAGKEKMDVQPAGPATGHVAIAPLSAFLDREAAPDQTPAGCRTALAADHSSRQDGGWRLMMQHSEQTEHHASAVGTVDATPDTGHQEDTIDSLSQSSASALHQDNEVHVESSAEGSGAHSAGSDRASTLREQRRRLSSRMETVPPNVIEHWGRSLDIVGPESRRCNCFTKTYFRWVKASLHNLLSMGTCARPL